MINEESEDGEGKGVLTINIQSDSAQVGKAPTIQQEDFESHGQGVRNSYQATADSEASLLVVSLEGKKEATSSNKKDDQRDNSVHEYWQRERNNRSKKRNEKKKKKNSKKEIVKAFHNQSLGSASPSTSNRDFLKKSYEIMKELQSVRDKGCWHRFRKLVITCSQKSTNNVEDQIIILLEEGQAACYNNRHKKSKKILKKARKMAKDTVNSQYLVARAAYYLSALYRRQKKFGKAINCVELASQNLEHTELTLDTAMLTYERASAWMDFILQCDKPDAKLKESVINELQKVIDQIFALKENPCYQCYFKTHRYAFIKIAMLRLDCRTTNGRRRSVNEANIKEAKKSLDVIKKNFWKETTRGEKIQFFLAQADLNFRMNKHKRAEKYASKARRRAKKFGFNTEIKLAEERVQDIKPSCALGKADGNHDSSLSAKHASGSHGNIAPVVEEPMPDGNHDNSVKHASGSHGNIAPVVEEPMPDGNHDNSVSAKHASGSHGNIAPVVEEAMSDGNHDNSVSAKHASGSHGNIAPAAEEAMSDGNHGKSSDGKPSDGKSSDDKSSDDMSSDGKSSDGKSSDDMSSDDMSSDDKSSDDMSSDDMSSDDMSSDDMSSDDMSSDDMSSDDMSSDDMSSDDMSSDDMSSDGKSSDGVSSDGKSNEVYNGGESNSMESDSFDSSTTL